MYQECKMKCEWVQRVRMPTGIELILYCGGSATCICDLYFDYLDTQCNITLYDSSIMQHGSIVCMTLVPVASRLPSARNKPILWLSYEFWCKSFELDLQTGIGHVQHPSPVFRHRAGSSLFVQIAPRPLFLPHFFFSLVSKHPKWCTTYLCVVWGRLYSYRIRRKGTLKWFCFYFCQHWHRIICFFGQEMINPY